MIVPSSGTDSLTISGTPTATGTEVFTVTTIDSFNNTTTTTYSITVNPALSLSPATLPGDTINVTYNQIISASGGTGPATLAVTKVTNAIPGLNLPVSGSIIAFTGVPTATGTETFTVIRHSDALGATTSTNYSITVNPAITLNPFTATKQTKMPVDTVGDPF